MSKSKPILKKIPNAVSAAKQLDVMIDSVNKEVARLRQEGFCISLQASEDEFYAYTSIDLN